MFNFNTIKKLIHASFNGIISNEDLTEALDKHIAYENYECGDCLGIDKVLLIVNGSISVINENNEVIKTFYNGFIGLHNLFLDCQYQHWYRCRLQCNTEVLGFAFDTDHLVQLLDRYPVLSANFYHQVKELNLLLLHFAITACSLINRVDLVPYLEDLNQILFNSGLIDGKFLSKYKFLILYSGSLIHCSGKEIVPGQVYTISSLPICSEWFSLGSSCLFVYEDGFEQIEENMPDTDDTFCLSKPNANPFLKFSLFVKKLWRY